MAMRLLDLFSGIGGFSYAAETLIGGYETVAFCEMDEFCQKVLKKHWPQVPIFDDVRTIDATRLGDIDICTFGFPCQPVSQAGLQKAESDDRWLWDEIIRILQASKPKWIIAENVKGLISIEDGLLLQNCITSLEAEGYEIQSVIIPACAKNAPHKRDRIWIIGQLVANTKRLGWEKRAEKSEELDRERSSDQSDNGSQGCTISNTDKDVANTKIKQSNESKNDTRVSKQKQGEFRGSSCRENVANTKIKGLQRRQFSSTISNQGNKVSNIRTRDSERSTSRSVEQRVGDMADGISRGILRHFDREPEHIPRVTKGEKDRAKKLKALGNSIVPQVAAEILLAIRVSEGEENGSN